MCLHRVRSWLSASAMVSLPAAISSCIDFAIPMTMSTAVRNCVTRSSSIRFWLSEVDSAMFAHTAKADNASMPASLLLILKRLSRFMRGLDLLSVPVRYNHDLLRPQRAEDLFGQSVVGVHQQIAAGLIPPGWRKDSRCKRERRRWKYSAPIDQSGMRLGWGHDDGAFFFSRPDTQRSRSAASRGSLYFAWGCFRDFLSRPCRAPPKGRYAGSGDTRSLVPRAYGTNRSSSNTSCSRAFSSESLPRT